jgi:hypothetical protein
MPICEVDPWRFQYFADVACPQDVQIPTEDSDAWVWNPRYRHVYDKLAVATSQGLACAPHGVTPQAFPVFSKPIINLRGMGAGSRVIANAAELERDHTPGHFWMQLLAGPHVSTDVAIIDGRPQWWRHATGLPARAGMFDTWTVHAAPDAAIEKNCGRWIGQRMTGYTGLANFETIGGTIIEVHLRFSDQWPDLYGAGWVAAIVRLYQDKVWRFDDGQRRDGYSCALFGPHGVAYRHPPPEVVAAAKAQAGVSSVQITFHEHRPPEWHAMPPGGFRLALINGFDSIGVRAAREVLRRHFLGARPAENLI